VTCSGDGTIKVWKVTSSSDTNVEITTTKVTQYNSMRNTKATLLYTLTASAPVYNYCMVFQTFDATFNRPTASGVDESKGEGKESDLKTQYKTPRLLSGSSDGRIRVWEQGNQIGALGAPDKKNPDFEPMAHGTARVQCLTIDQRSRYLLSGDSVGDILVWKLDVHGWYQSYRRFRQESVSKNPAIKANDVKTTCSGIQSLYMHPNPLKGQVLVMNSAPTNLRVFSTSTYRAVSQCKGVNAGIGNKLEGTNSSFSRAIMSPDGKFAVAGVYSDGFYELRVWESNTGDVYPSMISGMFSPLSILSVFPKKRSHH
jgi:WD40 repeat protein